MRCLPLALLALLSACSFAPPSGSTPTDAVDSSTSTPPDACLDDDHDGVCNDVDKCPGFDDHIDTDGDGVPDGCDDWPCGAKPTPPNQTVDNRQSAGWKVDNTMLGGNAVTLATVQQNVQISLTTKYTMDVVCFNQFCDAELKYGHDPGGVDGCMINGTFPNFDTESATTTKMMSFSLGSGTTPKVFQIKLDTDGGSSCQRQWAFGTPGDKSVIAEVCVTP